MRPFHYILLSLWCCNSNLWVVTIVLLYLVIPSRCSFGCLLLSPYIMTPVLLTLLSGVSSQAHRLLPPPLVGRERSKIIIKKMKACLFVVERTCGRWAVGIIHRECALQSREHDTSNLCVHAQTHVVKDAVKKSSRKPQPRAKPRLATVCVFPRQFSDTAPHLWLAFFFLLPPFHIYVSYAIYAVFPYSLSPSRRSKWSLLRSYKSFWSWRTASWRSMEGWKMKRRPRWTGKDLIVLAEHWKTWTFRATVKMCIVIGG